jgi:hypothetical protein
MTLQTLDVLTFWGARACDPLISNQVRYQTARLLGHPDLLVFLNVRKENHV